MGQSHILFMLLAFNIVFFAFVATAYDQIPGAPDPLSGFKSISNFNPSTPAGSTVNLGNALGPQGSFVLTCGVGLAAGVVLGGIVSLVGTPIAGFVVGSLIAGAICGNAYFDRPAAGRAADTIGRLLGPLGDSAALFVYMMLYAGAVGSFFFDMMGATAALYTLEPLIGLAMIPVTILTGFWVLYSLAILIRGGGSA